MVDKGYLKWPSPMCQQQECSILPACMHVEISLCRGSLKSTACAASKHIAGLATGSVSVTLMGRHHHTVFSVYF